MNLYHQGRLFCLVEFEEVKKRQAATKDFTPEQRRMIHELVYTGMLTRRTTEEIQTQVENRVNATISYNTVKHPRSN